MAKMDSDDKGTGCSEVFDEVGNDRRMEQSLEAAVGGPLRTLIVDMEEVDHGVEVEYRADSGFNVSNGQLRARKILAMRRACGERLVPIADRFSAEPDLGRALITLLGLRGHNSLARQTVFAELIQILFERSSEKVAAEAVDAVRAETAGRIDNNVQSRFGEY